MRKSTRIGTALLAVGTGAALATTDAAEHGSTALAVVGAVLTGSCTALGTTVLIVGWATSRPAGEAEEV